METNLGLEVVELSVMHLNLAKKIEAANLSADSNLDHERTICLFDCRVSGFILLYTRGCSSHRLAFGSVETDDSLVHNRPCTQECPRQSNSTSREVDVLLCNAQGLLGCAS